MSRHCCNICGGQKFVSFRNRGKVRCAHCRSHDRSRVLFLYLQRFAKLKKGMRVLHIAPERSLFDYIAKAVGSTYDPRDIDLERYRAFKQEGIEVRYLDLCTDTESLPDDHYDIILHNHVMEHIPCNVTAVLYHLHRSLAPSGLHMFSIPLPNAQSQESFEDLTPQEREQRFHQHDHVRIFGREDIHKTLGMLFELKDQLRLSLVDLFDVETLRSINIPKNRWHDFSGANLFMLRKNALKLKAKVHSQ